MTGYDINMIIRMEELKDDTIQTNEGVKHRILFRRLLAEMIERKIVKYLDRVENGVKRRYFWLE